MGDAYDKLSSSFDKVMASMEEMKALLRNQGGHCQPRSSPISVTRKYPYLFQNLRSTATPTQNQNVTRVSEIDFSKLSGSKVDAGKHKNEGKQLDLSLPTVAPTTVPIEHSLPTDSSSLSFNPFMSHDDDTEKSQVVDDDVADPASDHLFFVPTKISETHSHELQSEGNKFVVVADSVSVVVDQFKMPTPKVSEDLTPPPFLLNHAAPDTPTKKVGSSIEKKFVSTHWLLAPPHSDPPNSNFPNFMKRETPCRIQMKFAPMSIGCMSWFWVRKLRETDPELDWEKLKRALFHGSLVSTTLDFPNFKLSFDAILRLLLPILRFVLSVKSKMMIIWLNTSQRHDKIVVPVFFTLVASNVVFSYLDNVVPSGGGTLDSNKYPKVKSLPDSHHMFVEMPLSNHLCMVKNTLEGNATGKLMLAANVRGDHLANVNGMFFETLVESLYTIIEKLHMIDLDKLNQAHLEQAECLDNSFNEKVIGIGVVGKALSQGVDLAHAEWDSYTQTQGALAHAQVPLLTENIRMTSASVSIPSFASLDCGGQGNFIDEIGHIRIPNYGEIITFSVVSRTRYLLRETFLDGNFDRNLAYLNSEIFVGAIHWTTIILSDANILDVKELIFFASSPTISVCQSNATMGQPSITTLEFRQFSDSESDASNKYPNDHLDRICKSDSINKAIYLVGVNSIFGVPCFGFDSVVYQCKIELPPAMPLLPLSSFQNQSYSIHVEKTLRECKVLAFFIESVGVWVGLCTTPYFLLLYEFQAAAISIQEIPVVKKLALWCYKLGLMTTRELVQQIEKTGHWSCGAVAAHHGEISAATCQIKLSPSLIFSLIFQLLQLKLCAGPFLVTAHPLPMHSLLDRKWDDSMTILHRKLIPRGSVQAAKILLKWKALPPKHGTWKSYYVLNFILEDKDVLKGRVLLHDYVLQDYVIAF